MRAVVRNLLLLSALFGVPATAAAQGFAIRGPANAPVRAGQVTTGQADSGSDDPDDLNWGIGFIGNVDAGRALLANEDRLCDDALAELAAIAIGCDSETTVNAFSADVGITFARFLAAKVGYLDIGRASFTVSAVDAGITGDASGSFGRARGMTFTLAGRFDVGPVVPFVEGGVWRWSAQQGFEGTLNTSPPITFSDSFEIDSWDVLWGGGIEFWFHRNVGMSASFRNVRMQTDDTAAIEGTTLDETFRIFMVGLKVGKR